jgi:hypothetical protein
VPPVSWRLVGGFLTGSALLAAVYLLQAEHEGRTLASWLFR